MRAGRRKSHRGGSRHRCRGSLQKVPSEETGGVLGSTLYRLPLVSMAKGLEEVERKEDAELLYEEKRKEFWVLLDPKENLRPVERRRRRQKFQELVELAIDERKRQRKRKKSSHWTRKKRTRERWRRWSKEACWNVPSRPQRLVPESEGSHVTGGVTKRAEEERPRVVDENQESKVKACSREG